VEEHISILMDPNSEIEHIGNRRAMKGVTPVAYRKDAAAPPHRHVRVKKSHPALKHAGYSATTLLPGESVTEFEKLHRDLIDELSPNGVLEDDIVATMARLLWRKQNLATFRNADLARRYREQLTNKGIPPDCSPLTSFSITRRS
jgi:hypothetical protein